ncbi:MAG: hypothetical protein CM15mV73_150 [Caudoviricetes sp.]|nr:MAG: hypothetical protein CM15mV73_150 [Caudoviricetes sp.]
MAILVGQKYAIGQSVKNFYTSSAIPPRYRNGKITEVFTKTNSAGSVHYYYKVLWDDSRRSEHAQQHYALRLIFLAGFYFAYCSKFSESFAFYFAKHFDVRYTFLKFN